MIVLYGGRDLETKRPKDVAPGFTNGPAARHDLFKINSLVALDAVIGQFRFELC